MRSASFKTFIAITTVVLMATSSLPAILGSPVEDGGLVGGGFGPFDAGPWTDDFDDSSKVNITQKTVVTGGHVELSPGQASGLVASVSISAPVGYRYDIVVLEVNTPGASTVKLSVLNATEDSATVGYVNEPIPGYLKVAKTQVPITGIDRKAFPEIRLQADLEAAGTDRPTLLKWTVHFIQEGIWRDDFIGDGKVDDYQSLNFTGDTVEVDLSKQNTYAPGYGNYDKFPAIFASRDSSNRNRLEMGVYYANTAGNGYDTSRNQLYAENVRGFFAGDIDQDGYVDMVVANQRNSGDYTVNSYILWGDSSGTFDVARRANLATNSARDPALGDVNGDGFMDVMICNGGGSGEVRVWLNPKTRAFPNAHDISLPGSDLTGLASLDLNSDGYDDVVLAEQYDSGGSDHSRAYWGGPSGPDTTADRTFLTGSCEEVALDDFDKDGNVDVVFANTVDDDGEKAFIYYGSQTGPDDSQTPFKVVLADSNWGLSVATGDLNGDGWPDIAFGRVEQSPYDIYLLMGSATGFSNTPTEVGVDRSIYDIIVIDVNKDGYDDVIAGSSYNDRVNVYLGGAGAFDGNSDYTFTPDAPRYVGVVAGKKKIDYIMGTLVSKPITRPVEDKWDILVVDADIPPETSMEVTILDNGKQPIRGYQGLTGPDVDLGGVDILIRTIHIQVTLKSMDMVTTPSLKSMFVKWMDKNEWRDEFYGMAKVSQIQGFDVVGGQMVADVGLSGAEEIVFSNLRNDGAYNVPSLAYRDAGGLDYLSLDPLRFRVPSGAGDVEVADLDGDGFLDVLFAVTQTSEQNFIADSPVFFGSSVGYDTVPGLKFPTRGARDVLVADLNKDGHMDVVFAQEREMEDDYIVNSTLFLGTASGWKSTPDVEFETTGASGVVAVDVNKDGWDDLVFACYFDGSTTAMDSLVFHGSASGYDGSSPDVLLATRGARAVAAGDIDGNGYADLVFANSLSGGFVDIFSYVYWGSSTGYGTSPTNLPTHGAEGVLVTDVNGDSNLDVVFACSMNNSPSRIVDSFIYMGDGTQSLGPTPDISLPTLGATGIAVADLDGTGWKDLVFSCENDGATWEVNSRVYLGGLAGYGSSPDIELPTMGASGVAVAHLIAKDAGGYFSQVISPQDWNEAGVFHTFRYNAVNLPAGHTGTIQVLDADTGELLAGTTLLAGVNEWDISGEFRIREHHAVQIKIVVQGLDPGAGFAIDDLWLNWTDRNRTPPEVLGLELLETEVLRTRPIDALINVTDEYDFLDELTVVLEHRKSGTSDMWASYMVSDLSFRAGSWRATLSPRADVPVGLYDLRVKVTDSDTMDSGWKVYTEAFEVRNNLPTAPVVHIDPATAMTTSELEVTPITSSTDIESRTLTYHYQWYLDGTLVTDLTTNRVPSSWLTRGQDWTVEVRAWDGDDHGPAGVASRLIGNAPPMSIEKLVPPQLNEDTTDDRWTDLSDAFGDPDGDELTFRVDPPPAYVHASIDPDTGVVTYTPEENWWGVETITFWASDGESEIFQSVEVKVLPINDPAFFITVNGKPYTTGTIYIEVHQDEELVIEVQAYDVEGDDLQFRVINTTQLALDLSTGWLTYNPTNDNVGTIHFSLTVSDNVDTDKKMQANFTVVVLNVNDPVEVPRIISPPDGETYKWNESVGLRGVCSDPDIKHGQELVYSWKSNISGELGFSPSLNYRFTDPGRHLITLTVSDGETSKDITINITVGTEPVPPPPDDNEDDGGGLSTGLMLGIIVAIVVALLIAVIIVKRRSAEEEMPAGMELTEEEKKRQHLEQMAAAVKATADEWESDLAAERAGKAEATEETGPSIEIAGTGMLPSEQASHKMRLSEASSSETQKLWSDMEQDAPAVDDAEKEALRKENEKRKVQSAIQALPYGIPAPALRHIQPQVLADEIVEGAKHELPDGTALVAVRGKWYHGDPEDSAKFLMPYEMKDTPKPPAAAGTGGSSEWEEEA